MAIVAVIRTSEHGDFLMLDNEGFITAFKDINEGLRWFEGGYNDSHSRGYSQSISACMHWMQFQPSIIQAPNDTSKLEEMIIELKVTRLNSVAGSIRGLALKPEFSYLWENGIKPRLITGA